MIGVVQASAPAFRRYCRCKSWLAGIVWANGDLNCHHMSTSNAIVTQAHGHFNCIVGSSSNDRTWTLLLWDTHAFPLTLHRDTIVKLHGIVSIHAYSQAGARVSLLLILPCVMLTVNHLMALTNQQQLSTFQYKKSSKISKASHILPFFLYLMLYHFIH